MKLRRVIDESCQSRRSTASRRYRGFWGFILVVALMMSISIAMAAQETSSRIAIRGTVLDSTGKPVGDALVRLEQVGSPGAITTASTLGAFVFPAVQAGNYLISAEKSGQRSR